MRVVFDGSIEKIIEEMRTFLEKVPMNAGQQAEKYKAPAMMPLLPEKPKESKKEENISAIKAAYYAAREKKLYDLQDDRKKGRPKGSKWDDRADEIVKAVDEEGKSFSQIGRELGCNYKTISHIYYKTKGDY